MKGDFRLYWAINRTCWEYKKPWPSWKTHPQFPRIASGVIRNLQQCKQLQFFVHNGKYPMKLRRILLLLKIKMHND